MVDKAEKDMVLGLVFKFIKSLREEKHDYVVTSQRSFISGFLTGISCTGIITYRESALLDDLCMNAAKYRMAELKKY